jgi:hypothetical protein
VPPAFTPLREVKKALPSTRKTAVVGVLSALAVAATACTGEEPATSSEASAGTTEAPPVSDVPATPGGTTLAIGQQAVVPYDDGFDKAVLGITVTAIEPGDQAEYQQVFEEDAAGSAPFYVRYTVENLSDVDLSTKTLFTLFGSTVKGEEGTGVVLFGELPDCRHVLSPEDFTTVGATFENCYLVAAPTGKDIVEVGYDGLDYDENPIVWAK